jgi:TolB-like protein
VGPHLLLILCTGGDAAGCARRRDVAGAHAIHLRWIRVATRGREWVYASLVTRPLLILISAGLLAALLPGASLRAQGATPEVTGRVEEVNECKLAVLDLVGKGLPEDEAHVAEAVTESLATAVSELTDCRVITESDVRSMLAYEEKRQALGCDDDSPSCLAEIGGALGVERLVAGTVSRLGDLYAVNLRVIDIASAEVGARAEVTSDAKPEALREATKQAASKLLGAAPAAAAPADAAPVTASGPDVVSEEPSVLGPALLWTGAGTFALAGATAGVTGGLGLWLAQVRNDPTADGNARADAEFYGPAYLIAAGVAGGVAVAGLGLMGASFLF